MNNGRVICLACGRDQKSKAARDMTAKLEATHGIDTDLESLYLTRRCDNCILLATKEMVARKRRSASGN